MLPEFPKFKKLELTDREDIEKITLKFAPYSDFNFVSMWSWDIKGEMRISRLNDNMVVRFTHYLKGQEAFYSFLGNNNVNGTIKQLLDFSVSEGFKPQIRIVPKDSIKNVDSLAFTVEEDLDHFDYIYGTEDLKNYKGRKFETKRNFVNRFLRVYPQAETRMFDLADTTMQKTVLDLYATWVNNKIKEGKDVDADHEITALQKFFSIFNQDDFLAIGIFIDGALASCSIIELLTSDYVLSHFFKANSAYIGIYPYMMQEGARIAFTLKNKQFFNFEQDLGIPGLRKSKTLFRPRFFLKKFSLTPKTYPDKDN